MEPPPLYHPRSHPPTVTINPETASIHSLAPSYHSATPSYHSTLPSNNFTSSISTPSVTRTPRSSLLDSSSLSQYRIPTWSNATTQNPSLRHYQRVAQRRTLNSVGSDTFGLISNDNNRAGSESPGIGIGNVNVNENVSMEEVSEGEETESIRRPLEDEELVGQEAAQIARSERLERERLEMETERRLGDEVLKAEDERWDWMLNQMRDWDQREKSWQKYKKAVEGGRHGKGSRNLGVLGRFGR